MQIQLNPPSFGDPGTFKFVQEYFRRLIAAVAPWAAGKRLENVSVKSSSTSIGHNLGLQPTGIIITPRGNATIWQAQKPDATNVYLQASTNTTCDLLIY